MFDVIKFQIWIKIELSRDTKVRKSLIASAIPPEVTDRFEKYSTTIP